MAAAFARTALEFGGIDILVSNAGICLFGADRGDRRWRCGTATWTSCRPAISWSAARRSACARQEIGGNIVFVASKNGLAASPNAAAYCTAKAAEIHLARCLALEGAEAGIRVNMVNPDAVLRGSKIWTGEWREQRAAAYKMSPDELEEHYRTALDAEALGVSGGHRRGGLSSWRRRCRPSRPATSSTSTRATRRASRVDERPREERDERTADRGRHRRDGQCAAPGGPPARLRGAGRAARPPRHRHRRACRQGGRLRRRHPDMGGRHRRHAVRPLPGARRATRHVRQDRGLRGHRPADAGDAQRVSCTSPGTRPTRNGSSRRRAASASASTR